MPFPDCAAALIEQLKEMDGVIIRDLPSASPYVLNISLLGYRSEIVLHYLEQREVYISSGSACSKGASSGVLELFGCKAGRSGQRPAHQLLFRQYRRGYCGAGTGIEGCTERSDALIRQNCRE